MSNLAPSTHVSAVMSVPGADAHHPTPALALERSSEPKLHTYVAENSPHAHQATTPITAAVDNPLSAPHNLTDTTVHNTSLSELRRLPIDDRLPLEVHLLTVPDAELCTRFGVPLIAVWRWKAHLSWRTSAAMRENRPKTVAEMLGRGGASSSSSSPSPAFSSSSPSLCLPTGLPTLDAVLLGGLRRGWVTELTGTPGSGKTTLALAWCRHIITRDGVLSCDCVWMQSRPAVDRAVMALAAARTAEEGKGDEPRREVHAGHNGGAQQKQQQRRFTSHRSPEQAVHIACLPSLAALQHLLETWLHNPSALRTVGLLVVDSVTELLRQSFTFCEEDALQRHDTLASVLQSLKRLAEEQQKAVLVLTQQHAQPGASPYQPPSNSGISGGVSTVDEGELSLGWEEVESRSGGGGGGGAPQPAAAEVGELGRLFFHNVNVRLRVRNLVRVDTTAGTAFSSSSSPSFSTEAAADSPSTSLQWRLEVLKCPLCSPLSIPLQLEMSRGADHTQHTTGENQNESGPWRSADAPPLRVREAPDVSTAAQPTVSATAQDGGALYGCIDPWDHTEIPAFVYL